jgi:hypothetical protein
MRKALDSLACRLPSGWTARQAGPPISAAGKFRPDALFEITAPDGQKARVIVGVKRSLEPRESPRLVEQLRSYEADAYLVIAPFVSVRTREVLRELECGFADPTGNFRLSISRPGLFIETAGAVKGPSLGDRPLQSLKGPGAGKAVRALCEFAPPFRLRELANRARLSVATLSRVIAFLDREALLERDEKGTVVSTDWQGIIRRWAQDYSFTKSNTVRTFLEPRGVAALREKLAAAKWTYAATGSLVASIVAPVAGPRLIQIYVSEPDQAAGALGLTPAEAGANVMLAEPFDAIAFERTTRRDGIVCAAWP